MARTMHSANEWKNIREKEIVETDTKYKAKYDCYYSKSKDVWLESKCMDCIDEVCEFCFNRPEKPSMCEEKDVD